MTRKIHAGILVAILIAGIFSIQALTQSIHGQSIIVVDDDGLDQDCLDQYNGGEAPDFNTINDAIAGGDPSGDTIIVCPGTYAEHVIINEPDLTLLGVGCSRTIIDPPGAGVSNAISIVADSATIGDFEITGGINGIESSSGADIDFTMIKHNCIHDNTEDGINMKRGSNNIIRDNEIFKNGDEGIFLGDDTGVTDLNWIGNNEVHNNGANGITMKETSSTGNEINGNEVKDNGPGHWGIDVDSDILVKSNKVISNRGGILAQGDRNTFIHNTSNENEQEGFRTVSTASLNTFTKNTAKANEQGFSDQGSMNTFVDNAARKNTIQGFITIGVDGDYTGNRARNNFGNGFEAGAASSGNNFDSNRSNSNGQELAAGFGFFDASVGPANTYSNNKCNDNFSGGSSPTGLCTPQP